MNIKEFSEATGISSRMLRHFEKLSLLSSKRGDNGYRQYSNEMMEKALAIKGLQTLGFSLGKIKEIFSEQIVGSDFEWQLQKQFAAKQKEFSELKTQLSGISKALKLSQIVPIESYNFQVETWPTIRTQPEEKNIPAEFEKVVEGKFPLLEKIILDQIKELNIDSELKFSLESFWFLKSKEWLSTLPKSYIAVYQSQTLYSYLMLTIPRSAAENIESQYDGERDQWSQRFIKALLASWTQHLPKIDATFAKRLTSAESLKGILAPEDVVIRFQYCLEGPRGKYFIYLVIPYAPIHMLYRST